MRTLNMILLSLVVAALVAPVSAADITGQWKAQAQGADITITFKVDGTKVTGTLDNSLSGPTEIREGKIEGDEISFYVIRMLNQTETKITWKGKVSGDQIKFTRQAQGGNPEEIIARRAK